MPLPALWMLATLATAAPSPADLNARLQAMSAPERTAVFAGLMQASGRPCRQVTRTFYRGKAWGRGVWDFECSDSGAWTVTFDARNSASINSCAMTLRAGQSPCWSPL